jgi:FlaA1/EpsC-like NDP-sugar epimerase
MKITKSVTFGSIVFLILVRYVFRDISYPRSIYVLDWMLLIMLYGGSMLAIRMLREYLQTESSGKRVLIIGAGDAGEIMVRDMKNNPQYAYRPVGFIDEDPYKKGLNIHGVPIFGPMDMLEHSISKYAPEEILICIPSASQKVIRDIYEACKPFNLPIKTLPAMGAILSGEISVSQIKSLSMEDLLQREPVRTDIQSVREYIEGRAVMVTGAGGSIGSELCRQIANYRPSTLILLDRYENGLFQVDVELKREHPGIDILGVIGDINDRQSIEYIFGRYRPVLVFHAAAHKHVPLMEKNPFEAVKNNVFGTKNLIEMSVSHGVEGFVLISTDKAVNPTSIMGATKRIAEFLVLNAAGSSNRTVFRTVRFGNVLGSAGSVIHLFREQIERGGPVTVTHPDVKRFFMLIPEAVQLVLIAASSSDRGEIFVLDMGEPINISDFAENVIRLSGFVPDEDIRIEYTGLRPGEKLFEELFDESEENVPSSHDKLRIAVSRPPSSEDLQWLLASLETIIREGSVDGLCSAIGRVVPGYRRP